jgi:nitrite reductase/ring-hydroxylating ferredoxin subunit
VRAALAACALALVMVLMGCVPDDGVLEVRVSAPEDAERPLVQTVLVDGAGAVIGTDAPAPERTDQSLSFHLVHAPDGEVYALELHDPGQRRCVGIWRPDFRPSVELRDWTGEVRAGWFRSPCQGEVYDLDGRCVHGPCPGGDMRRHAVSVDDDRVTVRIVQNR